MSKTVVGLFSNAAAAQQVKQTLINDGYDASDIKIHANNHDDEYGSSSSDTDTDTGTGTGVGEKISNFFRSLTGGDEHAHNHYASGVNEGGALLSVTTDDEDASEVASLLQQHGARDIEGAGNRTSGSGTLAGTAAGLAGGAAGLTGRGSSNAGYTDISSGNTGVAAGEGEYGAGSSYNSTSNRTSSSAVAPIPGNTGGDNLTGTGNADYESDRTDRSNLSGETSIPVIEEELVVGKREVDRGGVRIYSHVVERPAEADVTLRDERVNVERRTVNRPATAADFEAGDGGSIEVRASGEEAVIGKNSRVVEEVLVGKEASQRTEAIHDTVRKTEVEVEQITGEVLDRNQNR